MRINNKETYTKRKGKRNKSRISSTTTKESEGCYLPVLLVIKNVFIRTHQSSSLNLMILILHLLIPEWLYGKGRNSSNRRKSSKLKFNKNTKRGLNALFLQGSMIEVDQSKEKLVVYLTIYTILLSRKKRKNNLKI